MKKLILMFFIYNYQHFVQAEIKINISELKPISYLSISTNKQDRFDASGLTWDKDQNLLTFVNDKNSGIILWSTKLPKDNDVSINLWSQLEGKNLHLNKSISENSITHELDLEGVTYCQNQYLVISEKLREIFRINLKSKEITRHKILFDQYEKKSKKTNYPMPIIPFKYLENAGPEGIACDEKHKKIFLIQEREPRLILVLTLPTQWSNSENLNIESHFDLPSFNLPKTQDNYRLTPDFSDAHVDGDYLYVLYRNAKLIMKVDIESKNVLDAYSYGTIEEKLYFKKEPFGLAEGLLVLNNKIYVAFDNNNESRLHSPQDKRPIVVTFERPSNF